MGGWRKHDVALIGWVVRVESMTAPDLTTSFDDKIKYPPLMPGEFA